MMIVRRSRVEVMIWLCCILLCCCMSIDCLCDIISAENIGKVARKGEVE